MYFRRSRKGQNLPEIAIVVAVVAIAAILVVTLLGNTIAGLFSNLTTGVVNGPPPSTLVVNVVQPAGAAPNITVTGPDPRFASPLHPTISTTYTALVSGVYTITAIPVVGTVVPADCVSTCPAPIPSTFYPTLTSPIVSVPSYSHTSVVDYTNTVPDTVHVVAYGSGDTGGDLGRVSAVSHTDAIYTIVFTSFADSGFTPAINDYIVIDPSPLTPNGLTIHVSSVDLGTYTVVGPESTTTSGTVHNLTVDNLGTGNIACYSTSNVFNPCLSSVTLTTQRTYTVTFGNTIDTTTGITHLSFYPILGVGDVIDFSATTDDTLVPDGLILSGKSTPLALNTVSNTIIGLQGTIGDLFLQANITSSVSEPAQSLTVPLTSAIGTLAPPHASNSPSFGCGTDAIHLVPPVNGNPFYLAVHGNISLTPVITFHTDIFIADFWKDQSNDRFGLTATEVDTYHASLTSTVPFSVFCQVSVPAILDLKLPRIVLWDIPPIWVKPDIALNATLELTWVPPTGSPSTDPAFLAESRSNCPDQTQPCGQWFTLDGTVTANLGFDCSPSFHPSNCVGIHTLDFGHPTVNLQGSGQLTVKFGPRLNLKIEDFAGPYIAAYAYDKFSTSNASPPVPVDADFNGLGVTGPNSIGTVVGCQNDEMGIAFSIGAVVGIGPIEPLKSLVNFQLAEVLVPLFCVLPMTHTPTVSVSNMGTDDTATIYATATLTNFSSPVGGNLLYYLYHTTDCSGPPVYQATYPANGNGSYPVQFPTGLATGSYYLQVNYTGDTSTCAGPTAVTGTSPSPSPSPSPTPSCSLNGLSTNPDFETGSLCGWTSDFGYVGSQLSNGIVPPAQIATTAHSGTYAVQLNGGYGNGSGSGAGLGGGGLYAPYASTLDQSFVVPTNGATVSVWYKSICPSVSHTNPAETGDGAAAYIIDANGGFHTLLGLTCTNNNTWVQRSFAIPSSFGGTTMRVSLRNYDTTQAQCQSQFSCGGWVNWTATQSLFDDLVITPS